MHNIKYFVHLIHYTWYININYIVYIQLVYPKLIETFDTNVSQKYEFNYIILHDLYSDLNEKTWNFIKEPSITIIYGHPFPGGGKMSTATRSIVGAMWWKASHPIFSHLLSEIFLSATFLKPTPTKYLSLSFALLWLPDCSYALFARLKRFLKYKTF